MIRTSFSSHKAFTLAEILITLGIIGIISAMVLPGLMYTYKAHKFKSQFNKSYSTIRQVFKKMQADDVPLDPQFYNRSSGQVFYRTFKNYLSSSIDCAEFSRTGNPCYNINNPQIPYKTMGGSSIDYHVFDDGQLSLQDGTLMLFNQDATGAKQNPIWVWIDLNGAGTLPNQLGYDLFVFEFVDSELLPMGATGTSYTDLNKYCKLGNSAAYNGIACAERAVKEHDYFKRALKHSF